MKRIILALLVLWTAGIPLGAHAQTGWYELGGKMSDLHDFNSTLTRDASGTLYAAMGFGVFKWTGTGWTELGAGPGALNANSTIQCLVTDAAGNVYAAGYFQNALNKTYVAKWNGSTWSQVGTGANALDGNGKIYTMAFDASGHLYAAGDLYDANGMQYVAKWNGSTWSEVGTGTNAYNLRNRSIYSMVIDAANNIYATADDHYGTGRKYVIKWNGTTWAELGTGANALNANNPVHAVAMDGAGNIYAAGEFTNASGKQYVAKWNGTSWSELGSGANALNANSTIYTLAIDASGNIYAGGLFYNSSAKCYVAKWNGTSWAALGSGSNALNASGTIYAISPDASGNVVVAGDIRTPEGQRYISQWNGTSWAEMGNGSGALNATDEILTMCTDKAGNIYAAGKFGSDSAARAVAKWNGTSWSKLTSATGNYLMFYDITSIATDDAGNVYAGAVGVNNPGGAGANNVIKWDGSNWTMLGGTNLLNANRQIYTITVDKAGTLYATGNFTNASGKYYVAKWDGSTWSELGGVNALNANYTIYGLTTDSAGNVYAGGVFKNAAGSNYVAKFDGTSWSELGGTNSLKANDYILSIAVDRKGNIYTAGAFRSPAPVGKAYVAKWDGAKWSELGGSNSINPHTVYGGVIRTIATDVAGHVYTAGDFQDTLSRSYVAKWNDTAWQELGTTANPLYTCGYQSINSVLLDITGNVYAGGNFTNTRGLRFVARYDQRVVVASPPVVSVGTVANEAGSSTRLFPNPNSGRFTLSAELPAQSIGQPVLISIVNMLGQQVYSTTVRPARSDWSLDVSLGNGLAKGVYQVQLSSPGLRSIARLNIER